MIKAAPPIFKDSELQAIFEKDGFVKIELLSEEAVEQLKKLFIQYFPNPSVDFYSSSYENDNVAKKNMSDEIGKVVLPYLEKIFSDYTWFGSAFLSKGNGPRSEMPMHQDWTIVDEEKYIALNIWTPLQDTDEINGTLEVIKGSHLWHDSVRAPTLPFYYNGFQTQLKDLLTPLHTKATEAVVLNQAIIHYSKPNQTNDTRIAITTGIKSKGAPMLFHYWNKEDPGKIELFEQDEDFLIRFENFHQSIFQRPVIGRSIGFKPFEMPTVSVDQIPNLVPVQVEKKEKMGFTQKLFGWIKG
jgi:ectoine hydroxylase-related dioxygenase (phytanoyl-CoA dioxygenase family)